jgi:hypothetical protein
MIKVEINATGLDEVIKFFTGLSQGDIALASRRALGENKENARKWKAQALRTARATVKGIAESHERQFIPGFVREVTHWQEDQHMRLRLEAGLSLMDRALALGASLHTTSYYTKGPTGRRVLVEGVAQTPETPDATEEDMIAEVRDRVRQWVFEEKDYTGKDADVDFDVEAITDRLMNVLGLVNARDRWRQYLKHPEELAAASKLAGTIQEFITRSSQPGHRIVIDRERITGDPVVEAYDQALGAPDETGYGANPVAQLPPEVAKVWLETILAAWKEDVIVSLPMVFRTELARLMPGGRKLEQAKLF